jgi:hypothetical protein
MIQHDIDLGQEHYLKFSHWAPDDLPANKLLYGDPLPKVEKWGAIIYHKDSNGNKCQSCITFDGEYQRKYHSGALWIVQSWEPLTVAPSLLCMCGDHGHIRNGKWEKA